MTGSEKTRRDLLFGGSVEPTGQPSAAATLRLSIHAMACDFGAAVNLDQTAQLLSCGDGLEVVPEIEAWLSVYQSGSELTRLNASAGSAVVPVSDDLFDLLQQATTILLEKSADDANFPGSASCDYLHLFGYTIFAWLWARIADKGSGA